MKTTPTQSDRRAFLKTGLKTGGAVAAGMLAQAASNARAAEMHPDTHLPALPLNPRTLAAMPTRNLGKTGYKVGIFSLGGQAALEKAKQLRCGGADHRAGARPGGELSGYIVDLWRAGAVERAVCRAGDEDAAWRAFSGDEDEGAHARGFAAHDREVAEAAEYGPRRPVAVARCGLPEDVDAIFAKGGAMEALEEMKEQKVVRYLGVTGHYRPEALIDTVHRYPFDTILMALSAADSHIHSFQEKLLPLVVEKQMGIVGMKVPARGRLLSSWTPPPLEAQRHSWEGSAIATRPGVMTMKEAMNFALTHPVSTIIVGCDNLGQLEENVKIAQEFTPLSQTQMAALNDAAAPVAQQSLFFRFTDRSKG